MILASRFDAEEKLAKENESAKESTPEPAEEKPAEENKSAKESPPEPFIMLQAGAEILVRYPDSPVFKQLIVTAPSKLFASNIAKRPAQKLTKDVQPIKSSRDSVLGGGHSVQEKQRHICCLPECSKTKIFKFAHNTGLSRHYKSHHPTASPEYRQECQNKYLASKVQQLEQEIISEL